MPTTAGEETEAQAQGGWDLNLTLHRAPIGCSLGHRTPDSHWGPLMHWAYPPWASVLLEEGGSRWTRKVLREPEVRPEKECREGEEGETTISWGL